MDPIIQIIVVTFDNPTYLGPCIQSIINTGILNGFAKLTIVNHGKQPIKEMFGHYANLEVVNTGDNLGWERGLQIGLERENTPFMVFQNDDTFIPRATQNFYQSLLVPFADNRVGIVGPTTTVAAGHQCIFQPTSPRTLAEVAYAIFFTAMVRRSHFDEVGGIDFDLPRHGGDDIDLSIRMRKAGYKVIINPDAFIIHEGFKTGERVHGGSQVVGGWNSREHNENTNKALIQKHGFKEFMYTVRNPIKGFNMHSHYDEGDETKLIRSFVGCFERNGYVENS